MSDDRQELIFLATSDMADNTSQCSQTQNTGVLTRLLSSNTTSTTSSPSALILYIPAFRKIEPKPGIDLRSEGVLDEKEIIEKDHPAKSSVGRFLAINATKRGVKTCPVCLNKIGYRAKQCKHCSPSKIRISRKPRLQHAKPSVSFKVGATSYNRVKENQALSTSSQTPQQTQDTLEQDGQDSLQRDMISSDGMDKLHEETIVTSQGGGEQEFETMVSPQVAQAPIEQDVFESSLIQSHTDHLVSDDSHNQQLLDCSSVSQQENQRQLVISSPLQTQPQGSTASRSILLETDRHPVEMEDSMVSSVTEVSTSGDDNQKIDEPSQDTEVLNTVFISTKVTQNIDTQTASDTAPGRYSLQDLICGLLAQNQGLNIEANQSQPKDNEESSEDTDFLSKNPRGTLNKERSTAIPEPSYDANSVALFLGEMAQRNNGKKRMMNMAKSPDSEPKVVTLLPGFNKKCLLLNGNDAKTAKFRKIQPKDVGKAQEDSSACDNEKEENKEVNMENRGETQYRIMNGNATRRGVMTCSKCTKLIGCRSKICKHCKNSVVEGPARHVTSKTLKQSVKLCLPDSLGIQIFSVRKCKTGPELRCFVQFDLKGNDELSGDCSSKYSCDYPPCVTAKELGNSDYMCEHAKVCCSSGNTSPTRLPKLDSQTLQSMPYGSDMKELVHNLYSQCLSKGITLVQYVSSRTLAVVEHINGPLGTDIITFAHVRFENVKGQGCFQRQVFCSGRACMAWNFLSSNSNLDVMKSCSCVHYAAALWAIASDATLQKDLGEFLEAFIAQSKSRDP